jgi:hypothetical protein
MPLSLDVCNVQSSSLSAFKNAPTQRTRAVKTVVTVDVPVVDCDVVAVDESDVVADEDCDVVPVDVTVVD